MRRRPRAARFVAAAVSVAAAPLLAAMTGLGCQSILGIHDTDRGGNDGGGKITLEGDPIVGADGTCVTVGGDGAGPRGAAAGGNGAALRTNATGRPVGLAPCDAADPLQRWRRDQFGRFVAPGAANGFLAASVATEAGGGSFPVVLAPADDAADGGRDAGAIPPGRVWTLTDVHVIGVGELCLGAQNGDFTTVAQVELGHCTAGPAQTWSISTEGEIRHDTYCLDVPFGYTQDGNIVQTYECNTAVNQRFTLQAGGTLGFGGKCVDASQFGAGSGGSQRLLAIEPCIPSPAAGSEVQIFHIEGPLITGGNCLDASNGAGKNGAPLATAPCTGSNAQTWRWSF